MRATPIAVALTGIVLALLAAPDAVAAPSTQYWYGRVTKVADGDTSYVDIGGDARAALPIRNVGIQATETSGGPGGGPECHAVPAAQYMAALLPVGTKVRLAAYYAGSTAGTDGGGVVRLLRYVDKYNAATGRYDIDVQAAMLRAGLVVSGPDPVESARVAAYKALMQQAMTTGKGLWDPGLCGSGPDQPAVIDMWSHYDADGDDSTESNAEWVRIRNRSRTSLSLAGWKLRDAGHSFNHGTTYYTFPAGAQIPAYGTITLFPGSGVTSVAAGAYYLGVATTAWLPNSTDPRLGYPGKTIYLLDPQLDFRAWADYPCTVRCARPPVAISDVRYTTTDEYVDLQLDRSATAAYDLSGVEVTNDGWTKELLPGTFLAPGETLRVWCDRVGSDTRLQQYWGHVGGGVLADAGDTVVLRTAQSTVLDTVSWGTG
jgi:endonuclease YncB( thermonuclease family)